MFGDILFAAIAVDLVVGEVEVLGRVVVRFAYMIDDFFPRILLLHALTLFVLLLSTKE